MCLRTGRGGGRSGRIPYAGQVVTWSPGHGQVQNEARCRWSKVQVEARCRWSKLQVEARSRWNKVQVQARCRWNKVQVEQGTGGER